MVFAKLQRLIGGVLLGGMIMGAGARAEDPQAEVILKALSAARPDLQYEQPRPSPMAGLYEVQVKGGPLLYIDADASHFIAGDLFAVQKSGFVNLAEQGRQKERAELIAAVKPEDMIIFAPENPKATIAVFTDVDCGYCRKLHSEVAELNALGIAVHYLAFPRAGLGSPSFRKIASAWCAKDPGAALTSRAPPRRSPLLYLFFDYTPEKQENPPSTGITVHVTKLEASLSRKCSAPCSSFASPKRRKGVFARTV